MLRRRVGNSAASSFMKITSTLSKPERYMINIITRNLTSASRPATLLEISMPALRGVDLLEVTILALKIALSVIGKRKCLKMHLVAVVGSWKVCLRSVWREENKRESLDYYYLKSWK